METEYSIYLGQEQKNGFTGFLSEKNFFCVVEIFDGYSQEQGEMLLSSLSSASTIDHKNLAAFDNFISDCLKNGNVPLDTSLSAGYLKGDVMYLKTVETGEIYLKRKNVFEKLISGTINASGKCAKDDLFVFTTAFFTESLKGLHITKTHLQKGTVLRDLPENIKSSLSQQDDTGAASLFIKINKSVGVTFQHVGFFNTLKTKIYDLIYKVKISRKKLIIAIAIAICGSLLIWNIGGRMRTQGGISFGPKSAFTEKKGMIQEKIETAKAKQDSIKEGIALLDEARQLLDSAVKDAPKNTTDEQNMLIKEINDTRMLLLKREHVKAKEMFDFSLEEKNARGITMALFENNAFVLNPEGKVYLLSLDAKSMKKRKLSKGVNKKSLVAAYEKYVYVFDPNEGITRIGEDDVSKKMISKDPSWSTIQKMEVFNGNIYLLDGGSGDIYKYPVIEDGFGDRISYFKGSYDPINEGSSFSIDSSVYVSYNSSISKYTSGLKVDFSFSPPEESLTITKIIADKEGDELYVWDKKEGLLYVFSKEGQYKKQVFSQELTQGEDVVVFKNNAYILKNAKLYEVQL